jgi:hypothetical protein
LGPHFHFGKHALDARQLVGRYNDFVSHFRGSRLNEITVSDRARLEGLTQFRSWSRRRRQQTIEQIGHVESNMREGRFCATLFQTACNSLILNGEMSEWSIEHAWKLL